MKKYKGMCSYYKGTIEDKVIEALSLSQLKRLASRYVNKHPKGKHILYVDYVSVDEDGNESTPLPREYYYKQAAGDWKYGGEVTRIC